MNKINYNPKLMKKLVLGLICLLLVGWLTFSIVVSYTDKGHLTTNSSASSVEVPTGSYQDYIKLTAGIDQSKLETFDISYVMGENENNQYADIYKAYSSVKLDKEIVIDGNDALIEGDNSELNWPSSDGYKDMYAKYLEGDTGAYTDESGKVSFVVKGIEKTGFYNVKISYFVPKGKGSVAQRKVLVNDKVLFDELLTLSFSREYEDSADSKDADGNFKMDINGNDLKPSQAEVFLYHKDQYIQDNTGYVSKPYMILLQGGQDNVITFESVKENLLITELKVCSLEDYKMPTYEEYISKYQAELDKQMTIKEIGAYKYESEGSGRTSSTPTLYPTTDRTSATNYPTDPVKTKYNAIGGAKWTTAGDSITWTVNAEEAGLYQLAFRAKQDLARGMFATRKLYVDGVQPFEEAANLRFYYNSEYNLVSLGTGEGDNQEIYYLYLEPGEHTISLQATLGDYASAISRVNKVVDDLNNIYLKIIAITTTSPDDYTDYGIYGDNNRLGNDINGNPIDVQKIFSDAAVELNSISQYITKLTGEKSSLNNVLDKLVLQIGGKVDYNGDGEAEDVGGFGTVPRNITKDLASFKTNLSSLGTWVLDIQEQSLTIESFYLVPKGAELPNAEDNFFKGLWFSIRGFFGSFFFDYESIGVTSEEGFEREIEVWFLTSESAGREQANVLKNLIDMYFTYEGLDTEAEVDNFKDYDCNVILKVLAAGVLLPATLAGTGPDVAINVGEGLPMNYALRGAVYDLERFNYSDWDNPNLVKGGKDAANYTGDFDKAVEERFTPAEMVPFRLDDQLEDGTPVTGYYGFPNTASFLVMFYRTDIFEENGWEVPKTWAEVTDLARELSVMNLGFYIPFEGAGSTIFATILYQMGGQFYLDDNTACAFSEEVAKKAFEQWCSYFCDYGFDKAANFTNRFRSGEMPIGISGYTLYNTLSVFAPDIAGKWAFAPLPGVEQEDGTIENTGTLSITSSIIMEQSEDPEASWAFLKWWTSTPIQEKYSIEIESILGSGARHNTANIKALKSLPWSKSEFDILESQFLNAFGIPEVAGGYYISRNLENAIREVINNDSNPRETFAEYVELIDSEITRKREEFEFKLGLGK